MIRWFADKFPGFKVDSEVVTQAASAGSVAILQFFYDQGTIPLDTTNQAADVGLRVQWAGNYLAAGFEVAEMKSWSG